MFPIAINKMDTQYAAFPEKNFTGKGGATFRRTFLL